MTPHKTGVCLNEWVPIFDLQQVFRVAPRYTQKNFLGTEFPETKLGEQIDT